MNGGIGRLYLWSRKTAELPVAKVNRIVYALFEVSRLDKWRNYLDVMYGLKLRPTRVPGEHEANVDEVEVE